MAVKRQVSINSNSPGANIAGGGKGGAGKQTAAQKKAAAKAAADLKAQIAAYQQQFGGGAAKQVYVGVEAGSDLEKNGFQGLGVGQPGAPAGATYGGPFKGYYGTKKPLYKVGYQNSKQFSAELNNLDPNVILLYQQRLNASGMLDTYTPGKLDKVTRGAFKELLTQANQSATTWQSTLQDIEASGGVTQKPEAPRDPFVAKLDDPTTLKETFQAAAQSIYGGDLPDSEIDAMVNSYRAQQMSKQQAAYDTDGNPAGGTIETETDPTAFAQAEIKTAHPDQINRVKFQDTLGNIMKGLSSQGVA